MSRGGKSHPAIACANNHRYHRIGTVETSIGPTLTSSGGSIKRKNKLIEDSSARRSESSIIGSLKIPSARRSESSIIGSLKIPRLGGVKVQSLVMYGLCRFTSPEKECWSCGLLTAIQNHEVQVV